MFPNGRAVALGANEKQHRMARSFTGKEAIGRSGSSLAPVTNFLSATFPSGIEAGKRI